MKNALIKSAISLHKLWKTPRTEKSNRILVFSTTGVGDTLWGTPAIRAIKKQYPDAHLSVLTSSVGRQLLLHNPHIDKILTTFQPELKKQLQQIRADTALIFHISQRVMMPLSYFSGAGRIIGSEGINKGLDSLLTQTLEKRYEHEIERRLRLAKEIGTLSDGPEMEIFLTEKERKSVASYLKSKRPIIAIHPGAKDRFKQWPPHLFAEVGRKANATILITGGKDEIPLAQTLSQQIPGSISLAGRLSLRELAALIEGVDLFLTNDTGPMHIAFAMQTQTIALFGPTDPHLCGPHRYKKATVFARPPTCTPCLRKKCIDPFCMRQISPREVLTKISELL